MAVAARGRLVEPIPDGLLRRPLDFIVADHFRQRAVWGILEEMADRPSLDAGQCAEIAEFLRIDLAAHVIDEEEDLFPLLRRRCAPEDEIETVLARLAEEHGADERLAEDLPDGLCAQTGPDAGPRSNLELGDVILEFARRQRRHMMIENSIVMPLARARLLPLDLANLARRMAARRGVSLPSPSNAG